MFVVRDRTNTPKYPQKSISCLILTEDDECVSSKHGENEPNTKQDYKIANSGPVIYLFPVERDKEEVDQEGHEQREV